MQLLCYNGKKLDELEQIEKHELRRLITTLKETTARAEELTQALLKKCSILDEITNYIESSLIKSSSDAEFELPALKDNIIRLSETSERHSKK